MYNVDFLKKLTILYVEDEDIAREQFAKSLKRLFKEVILGVNGEDGYYKFQEARLNSQTIDLILSDINMPKMNGLEMLEKIRELDKDIPVMYTTARTETEYLQKAIELNVHHYALKPINLEDIIVRIQEVCEKKYYEAVITSKNDELKNYLKIINNVAAIFKIDETGKITFVNDLLCDLFNQDKESLVGKDFTSLFHSDTSESLSNDIWTKVKNNRTWNGDIKYQNHQKEPFFIRSTIFKLIKENGFDYINIGFISTEEVEKQREFHKSVLLTISDRNKKASKFKSDADALRQRNKQLEEMNQLLNKEMQNYKDRLNKSNNQIEYYEKKLLSSDRSIEKRVELRNQEKNDLQDSLNRSKKENDALLSQNQKLKEVLAGNLKEIDRLKDVVEQKEKRIESINEVLEHRESQIRKFNPDLLA